MEKYEFAEHRWIELGGKLHISEPKLETVRADNPLNAKACLRACLAHWLRWNYDVDKYGKPTMEKLAAAIKEMGLKHVASKILGETNGTTTQGRINVQWYNGLMVHCVCYRRFCWFC